MLRSYLKIAFRSLRKNRLHSWINIIGLSAGISVSMLILVFVAHEMSFDRFHINGSRIYRAEKTFSRDGRHSLYANPEFGPTLKEADIHVLITSGYMNRERRLSDRIRITGSSRIISFLRTLPFSASSLLN